MMCTIDARKGRESLVTIGAAVLKTYRKVWKDGAKIASHSRGLTRALLGGAFLAPPPLQTFQYISRTAARIVTKLAVPSWALILHIVTKHFPKAMIGCPQITSE